MTAPAFPIDAVYLWVDGADPSWQSRRNDALAASGQEPVADEALSPSRYRDNGELLYALRSLEKHVPWVRKVHLVTDRQQPAWLNVDTVNLVDHTVILPPDGAYPVYNSNVLELCMHRIPGLAEHFLAMNDDLFWGAPARQSDFFTPDGSPLVWVTRTSARKFAKALTPPSDKSIHRKAMARTLRLMADMFGTLPPYTFKHTPRAWSVSGMEALWQAIPDEIAAARRHAFRNEEDFITWLGFSFFLLGSGKGKARELAGWRGFCDVLSRRLPHIGTSLGDERFLHRLARLKSHGAVTFCMNDGDKSTEKDMCLFQQFLAETFPEKSRFER